MSKIEQFSRVLHHRTSISGQVFTVPTSNDHTDETWSSTDLYIGELGINISDDTVSFRSNNGIVRLATYTASAGINTELWSYSSPDMLISSTNSVDSIAPDPTYYTDLGNYNNPWKDLFLGGNLSLPANISANNGLAISETGGAILTSGAAISSRAPIIIYKDSNTFGKTRPLFLNSKYSTINSGSEIVVAASNGVIVGSYSANVFVAGVDVNIGESSVNSIHLGNGYSKVNVESNRVVVGNLAVRGITDDGTTQYSDSDWVTNQSRLRTSDSLVYDLSTINWLEGTTIQVKAFVIGTNISNPSEVYTCEIMGCFSNEMNPIFGQPPIIHKIGTPIVGEINTMPAAYSGDVPIVDMEADASGVYIKLIGPSSITAQWLCTYSHHRIINITP